MFFFFYPVSIRFSPLSEGGRIHLIPSAIAPTPSLISFDLQFPQSLTRLSSHSLSPASSMSFLAVLTFASHSLPSSLPCSLLRYIIIIPSNHMSIPSYSIRLCHSIQRFLQTQQPISSSIFFLYTNFTPRIDLTMALLVLLKIAISVYLKHHMFFKDIILRTYSKKLKKKTNLHYTRRITTQRARVAGPVSAAQRLSSTAPKKRRSVGNAVSDLTDPGLEPQTSRTNSNVSTTGPTGSNSPL